MTPYGKDNVLSKLVSSTARVCNRALTNKNSWLVSNLLGIHRTFIKTEKNNFAVMCLSKCLKCVLHIHSDVRNLKNYLIVKKRLTKHWIRGMNVLLKGFEDACIY